MKLQFLFIGSAYVHTYAVVKYQMNEIITTLCNVKSWDTWDTAPTYQSDVIFNQNSKNQIYPTISALQLFIS